MEKSQHTLYFGTRARLFKIANFQDPDVKRMLSKLLNVDKAALPKEELREVMDEPPGLQAHAPHPRGGQAAGWGAAWGWKEVGGGRARAFSGWVRVVSRVQWEDGTMPWSGLPLPAGGTSAGGGPMAAGLPWVTPVPPVQPNSGLHGDHVQHGPGLPE